MPGTAGSWEALVEADREYFERATAEEIDFPSHYPPRRFALDVPQVNVGRHSEARGTQPQIDLSGAPEDPAISHLHAILLRQDDGSYAVMDPGSSNGTTLNDDPTPITPNTHVPLVDGDRIHIGAWTTITIRHGQV
jgi:predicted component of type VI protein secretion system